MAYPVRDSFQSFPQQYPLYQTRAHQAAGDVPSTLNVNPYSSFTPASQHPQLQQAHSRSTRSSGSPASEDGSRPSLPSISNLLGIAADGDRNAQENEAKQQSAQHAQSQTIQIDTRNQYQSAHHELSSSQRTAIPPTPPLRNDSVVDHTQSPSTVSTGSSLSAHPYYVHSSAGSALNNMDAEQQRMAQMNFIKRHSLPSQPNTSPYGTSPYQTSPYSTSPGGVSNGSYYSPTDPSYPLTNIYHQRPLPSNFPPPQQVQSAQALPTTNPWEHHHYISPSSQASFPQSQDRYICQTCNKAFSRPSSLKIHSHSHTGEKPFKCPHAGCGKAFSVRSNMKRHERGCHTGASGLVNSHLN